jgi:recombination protein RecA
MIPSSAILPASRLLGGAGAASTEAWSFSALTGTITELSRQGASAVVTQAVRLMWEAQRAGEPVAWVTPRSRSFYPPDARENGLDLEALAVVRVPEARDVGKAADYLIRSGAFGLVVLDLGGEGRQADKGRLTDRHLTRLLGLARQHGTAIVCLTARSERPSAPSTLGSLISLRGPVERVRIGPGRFACELQVVKDKRRAPGWRHREVCRGPAGLR